MAKGGQLTVTIGAAIQDFQTKMAEAQKQVNQFSKDAQKAGVNLGVGASSGVTTAKAKYLELATVMKAQAERMSTISRSLAQSISLPIAGLAAGAIASSTEARRILDRFGSDIKYSMGRLGTTLARDLNLDSLLGSIQNFAAGAVTAFQQLPSPIRKAVEDLGEMMIILPALGVAFSQLLRVGAAVVGMFGALGTKAVAAAAASKAAMTGWAAWGGAAAATTTVPAAAGAAGMAGKLGTAAQWAGPAILTGYAGYKAGNILADIAEPIISGPSTADTIKATEGGALAIARAIQSGSQVPLDKFQAQLKALGDLLASNPKWTEAATPSGPGAAQNPIGALPLQEVGITVPRGPVIAELTEIQDKINEVLASADQPLINKAFNESDEAFATRLFDTIQHVTQATKDLQTAASGKPIFGEMAATATRDLALVDTGLGITQRTTEDLADATEAKIKIASSEWLKMAKAAAAIGPEWLKDNQYLDDLKGKVVTLREEHAALKDQIADAKLDRNFSVLSDSIQITEGRLEDFADIAKTKLSQATSAWMDAREEAQRLGDQGIQPNIDRLNRLADGVRVARYEFNRLGNALSGQKLSQDLSSIQRRFSTEGGFDANAAMRERLISERESLAARRQQMTPTLAMGAMAGGPAAAMGSMPVAEISSEIDSLGPKIEQLSTTWSRFQGLMQATPLVAQQVAVAFYDLIGSFSQGVGNAIAQVLVYGQSLGKMMMQLFKQIASQIISTLIAIGVQTLIFTALGAGSAGALASANIGASAGRAGAAAVAGAFEALGIFGFAAAPGFAAGAITMATSAGMTGIAAGAAVGKSAAAAGALGGAEGGIFTQPHWVGEGRTVPEIVLNRNNIRRYFPELAGGGRSQPISVTVPVTVDGYEIARASARYIPEVLRVHGTGWGG